MAATVLLLPGWQDSGPHHWQTRWERIHGYKRVQQHDWMHPRRGDWITRLEDVVQETPGPIVLAAHSLGCLLAAAWASISISAERIHGALLVAPPDTEDATLAALRSAIRGWTPMARQRLPFASIVVASRNDPFCRFDRACALADDWGSTLHDLGDAGHINADSGLDDWPAGQTLLRALMPALMPRP